MDQPHAGCAAPNQNENQTNNSAQTEVEQGLKTFGMDCQSANSLHLTHLQLLEQLNRSFEAIAQEHNILKQEILFLQEARRLDIPVNDYKRLYQVWADKPNWLVKSWRFFNLNRLWQWIGDNKKLWDLAQLLLIPVLLAAGTYYLQEHAKMREAKASKELANQEILNKYFDFMIAFLATAASLSEAPSTNLERRTIETWTIARAKTLTALQDLDDRRKAQVLMFLNESKLLDGQKPDIDLGGADLSHVRLVGIDLSGADLSRVNFNGADLSFAKLTGSRLNEANLINANLYKANLWHTQLRYAQLHAQTLATADLCETMQPNGEVESRDCPPGVMANDLHKNSPLRAGAGFRYPIIGNLTTTQTVKLVGPKIYADKHSWQQTETGGWLMLSRK